MHVPFLGGGELAEGMMTSTQQRFAGAGAAVSGVSFLEAAELRAKDSGKLATSADVFTRLDPLPPPRPPSVTTISAQVVPADPARSPLNRHDRCPRLL
jgi:hypothetical protein